MTGAEARERLERIYQLRRIWVEIQDTAHKVRLKETPDFRPILESVIAEGLEDKFAQGMGLCAGEFYHKSVEWERELFKVLEQEEQEDESGTEERLGDRSRAV